MRLALLELWRRPARFATAAVILTLIAVLLMFLGGLLDGLIRSSTGAIRAQDADVIVYSSSSQSSLLRSRIDESTRSVIEDITGVAATGGIGVVQLGARVPGNGPRDLASVALFGYEVAPQRVPEPPGDGEAWAEEVLEAEGIEEGMTVALGPARTPITIVGFVSDTGYAGQGSLWANTATWRSVLAENNPASRLPDGSFQALAVVGEAGAGDLRAAIDAATDGATESLTVAQAAEEIPGVSEQRETFNQIIAVTIAIAVVVIALFFALITVERVALYGVLKALGARSGTLFGGLVLQAAAVTLLAAVVAGGAALALDALIPAGGIPLDVTTGRILTSVGLLLAAALLGSFFSFRRIVRIEPAAAMGRAQ